ncbi:conserved protein of unknown function (plasmid) [Rhodovastum atsumiense]|uniref:Uncharacterized protein n=1 Tax=Rhodovastum atsumiense TaxID=504468 RepID=A0A5M6IN30_9PROT|nr:hypothetical protein [Rhodovastum atsumiense]KAA5609670.1 hypothetical protein F1189_23200 [Rhodovastum atsumiense]CAH2606433.1 conserved protein of unknown function [Rhodovastum atsumiense]
MAQSEIAWTPVMDDELRRQRRWRRGWGAAAKAIGVSTDEAFKRARELGLTTKTAAGQNGRPVRALSERQAATIRAMRVDGASWFAIGKELGVHETTARVWGKDLGLVTAREAAPAPVMPMVVTRGPLPAGHPDAWALLTGRSPELYEPYAYQDPAMGTRRPTAARQGVPTPPAATTTPEIAVPAPAAVWKEAA